MSEYDLSDKLKQLAETLLEEGRTEDAIIASSAMMKILPEPKPCFETIKIHDGFIHQVRYHR